MSNDSMTWGVGNSSAVRPGRVMLSTRRRVGLSALVGRPSTSPPQRPSPRPEPTIVLVHGAWAGPAGWDKVTAKLQADGYVTRTPTLGLLSSYDDVAIVRAQLDAIPGDKILVGHSYGGSVIAQAAAGRTDVLALVYTAAFVPPRASR